MPLDYEPPPPAPPPRFHADRIKFVIASAFVALLHALAIILLYQSPLPDEYRFLFPTIVAALAYSVAMHFCLQNGCPAGWLIFLVAVGLSFMSMYVGLLIAVNIYGE